MHFGVKCFPNDPGQATGIGRRIGVNDNSILVPSAVDLPNGLVELKTCVGENGVVARRQHRGLGPCAHWPTEPTSFFSTPSMLQRQRTIDMIGWQFCETWEECSDPSLACAFQGTIEYEGAESRVPESSQRPISLHPPHMHVRL